MIPSFTSYTPKTLAVKLTLEGERSVRKHHPWIFSNSIQKINKEGEPGDIAIVFSVKDNKVMGVGLYDSYSPIRIKMLHFEGGTKLDSNFFEEKIALAFSLRKELLKTQTNSYRLLFGENDGFPGLIADVYAEVLVVKVYSAIWWPYLTTILGFLMHYSKTTTGVLRLSRNVQKLKETPLFEDGSVIYGTLNEENVPFLEHGVHFSANVIKGHKTGYFLDHRYNRKRVGELSKAKTVLDVFAYAGGFSVHALARGAKAVTSVDISAQALELAQQNVQLNSYSGTHHTIAGDAFEVLQNLIDQGKQFDVVVIDPPSFAKRASEVAVALKKYQQLARLGIQLTAPKGLLVLASCSSRVTSEVFFEINETALQASQRKYKVLDTTYHDSDHPIAFPEGAYLKCRYYRFS